VVSTFHGLPDIPSGGPLVRLKRWILRGKRNHLVFVSESLRDALKWSARPCGNPPAVIPNGVDCSVFRMGRSGALRRELGLEENVPLLGALGNVRPSKRYDLLLEAFAQVKARMPLAHLVVAGQAKGALYEDLLGLRSALGLEGFVHFLGFREDVPQVLQAIDLFVLSSGDEGFSLATVQAMATGLPVVATRCGGPEEILEDGVTGRLVSVDDPMSLADGILEVLSLPDRGEALGKAARERAVSRFSVDTMVRQYEALYRRCLGCCGGAGGMRRFLKRGAELALVRSGLAGAWQRASGRDVVVLAYHNVVPSVDSPVGDSSLHLPLSSFSAQIDVLCTTHSVVPLRDLMGAGRGEGKPLAAITFDDAYRGALELGLQELLRRGLPATVFVAPGLLGCEGFWWDRVASPDSGEVAPEFRGSALRDLGGRQDAVLEKASSLGLLQDPLRELYRPATEDLLDAVAHNPSGNAGVPHLGPRGPHERAPS
jgi:hypothetical protein